MTPMVDFMIYVDNKVEHIATVSRPFFQLILVRYGKPQPAGEEDDGYQCYSGIMGQKEVVIWARSYNIG